MRVQKHLAFLSMAVAAAAIVVGVFSWGGSNTNAASVGSATFTAAVPGGSVALNSTVDVPINLTTFTPGISTTWGGYDLEISYDSTVVTPTTDVVGPASPCAAAGGAFWANNQLSPTIVSGCAFQTSTFTGTLETVTFQCKADGASPVHFEPRPGVSGTGTALFDVNAVDFDMTFVDGQIQCGTGGTLPTATPTNTATATNTPAATATPTNTVIPATATAQAAATQTAQNNFGGANTATPTPGGATPTATGSPAATATTGGAGSPVPTTPGGGQGGAVGTPTKPGGGQGAGITGPNTGTGGAQQGGNGLPAGWLIIGGIMLALTGGGLYVRSRKVR